MRGVDLVMESKIRWMDEDVPQEISDRISISFLGTELE